MNEHPHVDDPAVAAVLAAAAAPAEGPVPGEAEALAAFRSVYQPRRRMHMPRFSEKAKLIAAAVFGGAVVISGAATAATGSLPVVSHGHPHPTPASSHAPGSGNDDQGTDVDGSTDTTTVDSTDADTNTNTNDNKGSQVSKLARETPAGTDHGKVVCSFASDGKCVHDSTGDASTQGKAHQDNATTHRQDTIGTHGKAHANS